MDKKMQDLMDRVNRLRHDQLKSDGSIGLMADPSADPYCLAERFVWALETLDRTEGIEIQGMFSEIERLTKIYEDKEQEARDYERRFKGNALRLARLNEFLKDVKRSIRELKLDENDE